jgi:hypothetical protein
MWYEKGPEMDWWWAVEHRGHPFAFLRSLMLGDFAPGRLPLRRHLRALGSPLWPDRSVTPPVCPCGVPLVSEDLVVIERATGARHFLNLPRLTGRWPKPTDPASCWECCGSLTPLRDIYGVQVCDRCVPFILKKVRT